jgi:hypothetical protein
MHNKLRLYKKVRIIQGQSRPALPTPQVRLGPSFRKRSNT